MQIRDMIVVIGDIPLEVYEPKMLDLTKSGIRPTVVCLKNDDIPGMEAGSSCDDHHVVYEAMVSKFAMSEYEQFLWENGAYESPFYIDPLEVLKEELERNHGIDSLRVYAIAYQAHNECDWMEEENARGEYTDCIGAFLEMLIPLSIVTPERQTSMA